MPIIFTEAAGQVRLLLSDLDENDFILTDEMVQGYLAGYGLLGNGPVMPRGPILRAAADALDAIANSEALVSKVMQTVDGLQTDGAKVANALRTRADSLRRQAEAEEEKDPESPADSYFGVVAFESPVPREAAEWERW